MEHTRKTGAPLVSDLAAADLSDDVFQLVAMMEYSAALIAAFDADEKLRFANAAFRQSYFVDKAENISWLQLMRRNYEAGRATKIETNDFDAWVSSARSWRGKGRVRTYETPLHDGSFIWIVETLLDNGWIICVGTDVTPLNQSERVLRMSRDTALRESSTDPLTRIPNRRHIIGQLEQLVQNSAGAGNRPVSVGLLDIDRFKAINDRHGHQAGDEVLVKFAQCARAALQLRDGLGRVGGEEFLVLFPNQSLCAAEEKIDVLRKRARAECRALGVLPDGLRFSAGLTDIGPGDSAQTVFSRCDRALYAAKQGGRNATRRFPFQASGASVAPDLCRTSLTDPNHDTATR